MRTGRPRQIGGLRDKILALLSGNRYTPSALAAETESNIGTVKAHLLRLVIGGEVRKVSHGLYELSEIQKEKTASEN